MSASATKPAAAQLRNRKRTIALKLSVVARQMRLKFDRSVECRGLTRAQWTLIAAVARNPGATQRTIASMLEVREVTAGRLIDRLCTEGHLKRRESPSDRRAYSVYLTPAAQPLLDKLEDAVRIHENDVFAGFSDNDLQTLHALLDTIAGNLAAALSQHQAAKKLRVSRRSPPAQ